jgi:hypothetical protein
LHLFPPWNRKYSQATIARWVGRELRELPCAAAARGVVLLMPSVNSGTHLTKPPGNPVKGCVQLLVIAAGNVMNTNTRPNMAGLNTFLAKPPNTCFAENNGKYNCLLQQSSKEW